MCCISDIEMVEARWRLGLADDKELADIATDALVHGCESEAVIDIAAGRIEERYYWPRFEQALRDLLGRDPVSDVRAAWLVARDLAVKILSEEVNPEQGAMDISSLVYRMNDGYSRYPDWLMGFYNLVDDYEDYLVKPQEYRTQILQEARDLLELSEPEEVQK